MRRLTGDLRAKTRQRQGGITTWSQGRGERGGGQHLEVERDGYVARFPHLEAVIDGNARPCSMAQSGEYPAR